MKIKCENPVIIYNPKLMQLARRYQVIHLGSQVIDLRFYNGGRRKTMPDIFPIFKHVRVEVSSDNIEDYYIEDPKFGTRFPVFYLVPCGHCSLCRNKKCLDWMTRCLCESASSEYPPFFITLTYDNEHLPKAGVQKRDLQLFFKRLRINLFREFGDTIPLRYFFRSEYGSKNKRPHYHGLVWNLPYFEGNGNLNGFVVLCQHIQDAWKNGFVYLERAVDMSGKYCVKYFSKEQTIPYVRLWNAKTKCMETHLANDNFTLASRRPGIGLNWLNQNIDFFLKNPDAMSFTVYNKFNNETTRVGIPQYFKTILYPTISRLVSQDVRDNVTQFLDSARRMYWLSTKYYPEFTVGCFKRLLSRDRLCSDVEYVQSNFSVLDEDFEGLGVESNYYTRINMMRPNELKLEIRRVKILYLRSLFYLRKVQLDLDRINDALEFTDYHKGFVADYVRHCPEIDINAEVAKLSRQTDRSDVLLVRPDGQ